MMHAFLLEQLYKSDDFSEQFKDNMRLGRLRFLTTVVGNATNVLPSCG